MPSWERLQEGPEDPVTSDLDADVLLSSDRPIRQARWTEWGLAIRQFFSARDYRYVILILVSILLFLCFISTLLVVIFTPHNKNQILSAPVHQVETSTPFIEDFDVDNTTELSIRSFSPPEMSPMLDMLYDYLSLVASVDDNSTSNGSNDLSPLQVTVFYESLDKPSRVFFAHQFFPTYFRIVDNTLQHRKLMAKLIPFGNSRFVQGVAGGRERVQCEHNLDECEGNVVHACAIRHTNWHDKASVHVLMRYIQCMMADTGKDGEILVTDASAIGTSCAQTENVEWAPIYNCTHTLEGSLILHTFQQKTESVLKESSKGVSRLAKPPPLPIVHVSDYGILSEAEKKTFEISFERGSKSSEFNHKQPFIVTRKTYR